MDPTWECRYLLLITDPKGTCDPQRQYWLIWSSSYAKNAEKFCGDGKFDVVVDIYLKLLCLWITSPVMQVLSGRVLSGPVPYLKFIRYPIPDPNLYFHVSSTPSLYGISHFFEQIEHVGPWIENKINDIVNCLLTKHDKKTWERQWILYEDNTWGQLYSEFSWYF